jgi:hypothetical protein
VQTISWLTHWVGVVFDVCVMTFTYL